MKYILALCISLAILAFQSVEPRSYPLVIPKGFPLMQSPEDNPLTAPAVELGRYFFYEKALSRDRTLSCASCHRQELAFTDGSVKSRGIRNQETDRNAPTLANVGYQNKGLLLDATLATLEMQVLVPVQEHKEFDFHLRLIAERLKKKPLYNKLSQLAYERSIDPYVITRAIAAFQRTLISGNSPYDQYVYQGDTKALNREERKGMRLFFEELYCGDCHGGYNFTNMNLANNGLYEHYPDSGRMRLTGLEKDRALFRVPTLRNIELTAPYMHDGSLQTLEEVVEHYASGAKTHEHKDERIQAFKLTKSKKKALIAFLKSLTDKSFVENPELSSPFK